MRFFKPPILKIAIFATIFRNRFIYTNFFIFNKIAQIMDLMHTYYAQLHNYAELTQIAK